KIGLTTTLKNAWTTSRQVNFFWVANFNLKFGKTFFSPFVPGNNCFKLGIYLFTTTLSSISK
ncbi:TPA: hypothetical protein ACGO4F_002408, partial [Streptococcus suis]